MFKLSYSLYIVTEFNETLLVEKDTTDFKMFETELQRIVQAYLLIPNLNLYTQIELSILKHTEEYNALLLIIAKHVTAADDEYYEDDIKQILDMEEFTDFAPLISQLKELLAKYDFVPVKCIANTWENERG